MVREQVRVNMESRNMIHDTRSCKTVALYALYIGVMEDWRTTEAGGWPCNKYEKPFVPGIFF